MNVIVLEPVLTCPYCGFAAQETMPADACVIFYECGNCKTLLRPKPGDRCVFCSFGSVKCPPIQEQRGCCGLPMVASRSWRMPWCHIGSVEDNRLRTFFRPLDQSVSRDPA